MNQLQQTLYELNIGFRDMNAFDNWMIKIKNIHWSNVDNERYIKIMEKFN